MVHCDWHWDILAFLSGRAGENYWLHKVSFPLIIRLQPALFYIRFVLWNLSKIAVSEYRKSLIIIFQPSSWYDGAWVKECIWLEERLFHQKKTAPENTLCPSERCLAPSANLNGRGLVVKSRHWANRIIQNLISFKDARLLFHILFYVCCSAGLHTLPVWVLCFHLVLLNSWTKKSSYEAGEKGVHQVVTMPYLIQSALGIQSTYGSLQGFSDALRKHQTKVWMSVYTTYHMTRTSDV